MFENIKKITIDFIDKVDSSHLNLCNIYLSNNIISIDCLLLDPFFFFFFFEHVNSNIY